MIGLIARPYPLLYVGPADGATSNPAFPGSNLANNDYGRVATAKNNTSATTTISYVFDLGTPMPVDTLALLWHDAQPGESVIFMGSNTVNFATLLVNQTVAYRTGSTTRDSLALGKTLLTLPSAVTARYWLVKMTIPAGATRSASRFFVGKGAQFTIGPQKATLGAKDMNASVTTEVGEQRSQEDANLIRPVIGLSFSYGKQSEMEQVLGQYTLGLGVSKPMLVCTDLTTPYLQDNIAFGRPEKVVTLESTVYDVWSFEAVVTSLGV